jgi:hypothetical protein
MFEYVIIIKGIFGKVFLILEANSKHISGVVPDISELWIAS